MINRSNKGKELYELLEPLKEVDGGETKDAFSNDDGRELVGKQKIKELALANGFSLKQQASGTMDLHSYVYAFAHAVATEATASAVPDGYVLVPHDATDVINSHGVNATSDS